MTLETNGMSRVYVLPEGTPDHMYQAWVEAFAATVTDPEFEEAGFTATEGDRPNLGTPEELRRILKMAQDMTAEELELFGELAGEQ